VSSGARPPDDAPMAFRASPGRGPAVATAAMIATSQPSASLAGLQVLQQGGNAVDAAIAAAAVLCVSEPMSTGLGGDVFAIVADRSGVHGLDAAGPAPLSAPVGLPSPAGPSSAVVPGAVRGWEALSERFGRLGLDVVLRPAIDLANRGVAAGFHCSHAWSTSDRAPAELGPPPGVGERFALPDLGRTLQRIASDGPDAFYEGDVARAIAEVTWLEEEDLAAYRTPLWVTPMSTTYRGVEVLELPPPTQGIAALEGLALLDRLEPTLPNQIRAVGLALEDAFRHVRDGADVQHLLAPSHLDARLGEPHVLAPEPRGGTVYLCCVDEDGMAVSFIQSIFEHFGSGVVAPGTGVVLNNRAACFEIGGTVVPGRRPYHTIIPGMLVDDGVPRGPFGIMGGYIQAQAHVQFVSSIVDDALDPQAALDRPRFRLGQDRVWLEEGLWDRAEELEALGYRCSLDTDRAGFGGGQAIFRQHDHLIGGSDPRKDGFAAGY
jgi:gamma-glutamyltranspeptidase/glutathione hydrolase